MLDANNINEYTHDDLKRGIEAIATKIIMSAYMPDYIVGITRGGCVPAVYLSHRLSIPVVMVHWNTRDTTSWGNESNAWIPEDVNAGKRIIIVDDIVDGGDTIRELIDDFRSSVFDELNMDNIRVASLICNTSQDITVDFYHKTVDREVDQRWCVFPWEA